MNKYVRKYTEGDAVPKGWKVVTVPGDGTFLLENTLAVEIEALIGRNQLHKARTLMFWFGSEAMKKEEAS